MAVLQKVKRGDPLVIPAQTFNAFIDAAQDYQDRQRNVFGAAPVAQYDPGIVRIRNDSGADHARFDVLAVSGIVFDRTDNQDAFFGEDWALTGVAPPSTVAVPAVLIEPIAAGAIGRARIAGVGVVRVKVVDPDHRFADMLDSDATQLRSSSAGPIELIYRETASNPPETLYAIGRFGAETMQFVRVQEDGSGVAGSESTQCTYKYDIYSDTGNWNDPANLLASGLTPKLARTDTGAYIAAPDGTLGLARRRLNGNWQLLVAFEERPDTTACTSAAASVPGGGSTYPTETDYASSQAAANTSPVGGYLGG